MPKKCIKFVSGFLIPSLDNKTFGERLKWINRDEKKFQMYWFHKGGPKWTEDEAAVFVEWDKHKGHFRPNNKGYFTHSKQRFRALLYKLTLDGQLKKLKSEHKFIKMYCIGEGKKKKRGKTNDVPSDVDAEYELDNEDETSCEEIPESSDDILRRTVSEDSAINVLEDHSYSSADNSQNEDGNMDMDRNYIIMDTDMRNIIPEVEKRVLVERNDGREQIIPTTPLPIDWNAFLEAYCSEEDLKFEVENTTITRFSGIPQDDPYQAIQNKLFSENSLSELFTHMSSNTEYFELSQVNSNENLVFL